MTMATLLLRLAAPLQAWGSDSKFNIRMTEREPTKSGVIGLLASALGIKREDAPDKLKQLNKLRFGVRVEREGKLLKDFHMVHEEEYYTTHQDKYTHITNRYYLSDAVFLTALESDDKELLKKIEYALENPVYPLFLGRRSCPPTLPIVLGIRDEELITALKKEPPIPSAENTENFSKRLIYDSDPSGVLVRDVPVSFSQVHRQYGFRYKSEETLLGTEHDPMAEL